jgi:hypothetical protein
LSNKTGEKIKTTQKGKEEIKLFLLADDIPMLMDQQNQYCENDYIPESNLYAQCNLH